MLDVSGFVLHLKFLSSSVRPFVLTAPMSHLLLIATAPLSRGIPSHHSLNIYLMLVKYRQFSKQPIQDRSHQHAAEKNDGWPCLRFYDCHKQNRKESRKWLLTETVWNATISPRMSDVVLNASLVLYKCQNDETGPWGVFHSGWPS